MIRFAPEPDGHTNLNTTGFNTGVIGADERIDLGGKRAGEQRQN
jgi:hypothetical protein